MIEICDSHGFTVKRSGTWLWLSKTDDRYNKPEQVNAGKMIGIVDVTSKDVETKVLMELGFKYSSNRGNWYWIEDETTRKVKPERAQQNKQNEYFEALLSFKGKNESTLADNDFEWNFINDVMYKDINKLSPKQKEILFKIINKHDKEFMTDVENFIK